MQSPALVTLAFLFTNGISASVGNLSVTEKPERCILVLRRLTYAYFLFAMIVSLGLLAVCNLFIEIWLGPAYLLADGVVFLAIFNLFLEICCEPLWRFLETSGLFQQDRNIAIIGSSVNLFVSIILGLKLGIVGIFVGTVCTQVIQLVLKTKLIYSQKYNCSPAGYLGMWMKMILVFFTAFFAQTLMLKWISIDNIYISFVVKGIISCCISCFISVATFIRSEEFTYFRILIMKKLRGRGQHK